MTMTDSSNKPRARRRDLALSDLAEQARSLGDGLASLASWLERGGRPRRQKPLVPELTATTTPKTAPNGRRRRGRPSRAEQISPELLAVAPSPDLLLAPADRVGPVIRAINDPELLRRAYAFEAGHDRRKTVIVGIEQRLRRIGDPIAESDRIRV